MTDNRTTELLPCPWCGGEADISDEGLGTEPERYWAFCANGRCFVEGTPAFTTEAEAIAAWNTRADYHGYKQAAIEAWENIKAWNTRAERGTLTAEQVRNTLHGHCVLQMVRDLNGDWMPQVTFDWQAIADELNAELGSGTCEIETTENWLPAERYHRCKHCGAAFFAVLDASGDIQPCVCPNCGKAVKR